MRDDIKTQGIVLRRTNYGEADRILNIITPEGKVSAIARGSRKEKSKLAGGIEMFTLADFRIHTGRGELGVVTSAKMLEHYGGILKDYERMEFAGIVLKKISAAAENSGGNEFFEITRQCLKELSNGTNLALVKSWFWLNLARVSGEEVNLYRDTSGERLRADEKYDWDVGEMGFARRERGGYGADEIKMLRILVTSGLDVAKRVKLTEEMGAKILHLAQIVGKI